MSSILFRIDLKDFFYTSKFGRLSAAGLSARIKKRTYYVVQVEEIRFSVITEQQPFGILAQTRFVRRIYAVFKWTQK